MSVWSTMTCDVFHRADSGISIKKLLTERMGSEETFIYVEQEAQQTGHVRSKVEVSTNDGSKAAFKRFDEAYRLLVDKFGAEWVVQYTATIRWS